MSNPLTYQSLGPDHNPALQITTWIYLLVLGILNTLLATCVGCPAILLQLFITRSGGSANFSWTFFASGLVLLTVPGAIGTIYIWSAMRVRRGSDAAVMTSLITTIINALLLLIPIGAALFSMAQRSTFATAELLSVAFYLLPFGVTLAAVFLLIKLRRQWRQPTLNA